MEISAVKMIPVLHLNCTKIVPFSRVHAVLSDRNKYVLIHLHRWKLNTCTWLCVSARGTEAHLGVRVSAHTPRAPSYELILNSVVSQCQNENSKSA